MYLYNSPEYCETNFAAIKIRGVPINVNYRYLDDELRYLLDNADVEALVFHSSLADRVARVARRAAGAAAADRGRRRPGARRHAARRRRRRLRGLQRRRSRRRRASSPSGDDIYIFYTGGTTGMPKGVMYPMGEFTAFFLSSYPPMIGLAPVEDAGELPATAQRLFARRDARWSHVGPAADARHRLLAGDDGAPPVRRHGRAAGGPRPRRRRAVGRRRAGAGAAPRSSSATPSPSRCCAPSTSSPTAGTCRACG